MELNKQKFSLAAGGTMAIVSAICAAFVALWPEFAVQFFGWLVHLVNLEPAKVTLGGAVIGIIQAFVYAYIFAWIFVSLHNWAIKR